MKCVEDIISSPLKRAYETACLIRNGRDIEIETDDRLRELSFGHFEGQNFSELIKDESLTFRYFFKQPELYVPADDAETLPHLIARAGDFMQDKIEPLATSCERVMIVAHGALNRYDVDTCDDWNVWIDGPWPWEGACGC